MLGLRYLVCADCGTVAAVPDDSTACVRCGAEAVEPVSSDPAAAAYFAGALDDGDES